MAKVYGRLVSTKEMLMLLDFDMRWIEQHGSASTGGFMEKLDELNAESYPEEYIIRLEYLQ